MALFGISELIFNFYIVFALIIVLIVSFVFDFVAILLSGRIGIMREEMVVFGIRGESAWGSFLFITLARC